MPRLLLRAAGAALVGLLTSAASAQQPGWAPPPPGRVVAFEVIKPTDVRALQVFDEDGIYIGDVRSGPLTSALALSARLPVGGGLVAEVQLPVSVVDYDGSASLTVDSGAGGGAPTSTEVGVGNPYVGVTWTPWTGATAVAVSGGVRLPLAGGDVFGGGAGDAWLLAVPEQREAFLADLASVRAALRVRQQAGPVVVDVRLAPVVGVTTEEYEITVSPREPDVRIRPTYAVVGYGLLVTGRAGPVELAGGVIGSERVGSVDEYLYVDTSALVAHAALAGRVRPHLSLRRGVGDFGQTSVGAGVSVTL